MGVKSNKVVSLLKEDISTGFARILGDFIKGVERNAGELELNGILKSLNPDERKLIDEFADDVKAKTGKDFGFKSVDDLVSVAGKLDVYKALASTIKSNSDTFFKTLGKKFNLNSLPVVLTQKQQVDQIMSKLLASADENQKYVINLLQKGETESLLPAQRKIFADQLRKINDPEGVAKQMADQFESSYKIIDDVETELGGGSKTVDADYKELVFDEVSGEWVEKGADEGGDAARGADDTGGDAARGADDTGGRTYSMPDVEEVALDQTIDGIRSRLYGTVDDVQLKQIYATLVSDIKTSKVKFPFDNNTLALFKEMEQRGLLKEDDLIGNILAGNITTNPDVIKMQELVAEYNAYKEAFKKNPVMYMGTDGVMKQGVPEDFVNWSIKNKKTLPSNVNKQRLLGKGLEYLNDIFVWPFTRLIGKNKDKGSFSDALLRLAMGFGGGIALTWQVLGSLKTVGQGGINFVNETPMAQKTTIKEGVKTYFNYDSPQLIIDGKAENIYAQGIDKTRASNLNLKNATPIITFDLDIKQRQFSLNPGIVINGKKYTSFTINFGEGNFVTQGKESFDNKNVLIAITQTTTTTGTYTNDLKGFLAWCKAKGYTDCTNVGGKWEYKDKSGSYQQGKYVDTDTGWGN